MKVIGENRIADLWDRIKNYVDPKADKIPEVNHGTSDTTFTLTPNIMHIWGEVSSLTLTFPEDTNTVLDEFMFTFTSPSTPTTLTLPATIKWIQEPNIEAGKTYQVSVVNGLAGYLTDDMPMAGDENIIEEITVNGTTVPVVNKVATITGTVNSVTVNGNNYTPDANGLVNLGTISGGEGGTGGEYNVIEGVTFNGTTAPITNKIAAITYTAPTLSKGTTTGNGNAVTDISVSGHTVTLTKGSTFLTSHQSIKTLNTNNTTAQTANTSEAIAGSGIINLHKVAKTGNYEDLIDAPNVPTSLSELGDATNLYYSESSFEWPESIPTLDIIDTGDSVAYALEKLDVAVSNIQDALDTKQNTLVSGTNIKTINNQSLLGSGNITISGASGGEANVIESVKVNGTALTVTNKAVDITAVPASIVTQDATHRMVSDTEKSTWNNKVSTDTKNTAGATTTTVTGSKKFYLVGAPEQTANPTTNTINYFYVDASGLNIPTDINALQKTATLGKIILPGTGGGILADGTGSIQSTTKVWNTFGSYTDISGLAADSNVVHKSGDETITGDKTFSGQIQFDSGNPVYFLGDNIIRGDVYITNEESGATNVQITTDNNNDNRVVVKASETGFSWIQASNGTLDLQSVLDAKQATLVSGTNIKTVNGDSIIGSGNLNVNYQDGRSNEYYVTAGNTVNDNITALDDSLYSVESSLNALRNSLATIYSGSSTPASSLGNNGDIYIKVS